MSVIYSSKIKCFQALFLFNNSQCTYILLTVTIYLYLDHNIITHGYNLKSHKKIEGTMY